MPAIIVTGFLTHRRSSGAKSYGHPFSRVLVSDGQEYRRECEATSEWQPLDYGWVPDASLVFIDNCGDAHLEVSFDGAVPHALVPMGEDWRVTPMAPMYMRGAGKFIVTVLPS